MGNYKRLYSQRNNKICIEKEKRWNKKENTLKTEIETLEYEITNPSSTNVEQLKQNLSEKKASIKRPMG